MMGGVMQGTEGSMCMGRMERWMMGMMVDVSSFP